MEIMEIALAATASLAPFSPILMEIGKIGQKKITEMIVQKGGEAAWRKSRDLWSRLTRHFKDDRELESALTLVAMDTEDETRLTSLTKVLAARLRDNEKLAEELEELLGGPKAVQEVLADGGSTVRKVKQKMIGDGYQNVHSSDNSEIDGVKQVKM